MLFRKMALVAGLFAVFLSVAACEGQEEKQARYMDRGNAYFERGEYKKARIEYKNAARIKPSDAQVRYRMGLVDEAEGDLRAAFRQYMAAEQQDARFHPALKKLVQYFLAGEQNVEARKRVDILLRDLPDDADAHALNAACFLRQKELGQVESEARFALSRDPANVTAYTVLTGLYVAQKDQAKAAETIEEAIERNPKNLSLLLLKAVVYEKEENIDKIAEAYNRIFQLNPTEARFRDDLAKVYVRAQKSDEAEAILREGVAKAPDNWGMKQRLLAFLNENRGMEAAERALREWIKAYPERHDLYFWLADLYITNKATDRAIELLEQMVAQLKEKETERHGLNAQTSLARIHFVKGNKDVAEKLARHVLETQPNNKEALFIHAQMLVDQGLYQEAVVALRTIVRDDSKAADALQLLSEVLLAQGYLDLAVDTQTQLVEAAPAMLPAKIRLAQMLAARGETDRALGVLALVTKIDPSHHVGWESVARIALGANKPDVALAAIHNLEKLDGQARTALFLKSQHAFVKGSFDEAIEGLKRVLEEDAAAPIAGHALSALAEISQRAGKMEAFADYLEVFDAKTPLLWSFLGEAQARLGRKDKALAAFEQALAGGAPSQAPFLGRARLLFADNRQDEAIALLDEATKKIPSDMRAFMMRADMLALTGRFEEAIALYDALLARNPNNDVAANNVASLISEHKGGDAKEMEKARILAERFIRSENPYHLDTLAWVYFRQEKMEQAQTIYERMEGYEKPLPAAAHYHYGLLLLKRGNNAKAKDQLEKALSLGQSFAGEQEARALLKGL